MRRSHFSTSHTHPKKIDVQWSLPIFVTCIFSYSYLSSLFILSCTSDSATLSSWSRLFLSLLQLEALLSKAAKGAPRQNKAPLFFTPFNERPSPCFLFICGSGSEGLFFSISRISQPIFLVVGICDNGWDRWD